MEPELFSFSKKPIEPPVCHRPSVISSHLPSESGSARNSTSSSGRNVGRSFSSSSNSNALVDANMMADDPLTDYNEQIRAPKFKQQKNLRDIGESLDKENNTNKFNDLIKIKTESLINKNYQPAEVDVSKIRSALSSSEGCQEQSVYTIDDFLQHVTQNQANNLISNLNLDLDYTHTSENSTSNNSTTTSNTSPISSKKPSHESIVLNFIESNKQPRFNLVPIKPIDELKSPNYLPCVLRPTSNGDLASLAGSLLTRTKSNNAIEDQTDLCYKPHWKPNNSRSQCLDCEKPFSLMNRRHHCRKCGEIFCGNCLVFKAKLQYDDLKKKAEFDSLNGITCKVCFKCGKNWSDHLFKEFKDNEDKQSSSTLFPNLKTINENNDSKSSRISPSVSATVAPVTNISNEPNLVPADWSWSSF